MYKTFTYFILKVSLGVFWRCRCVFILYLAFFGGICFFMGWSGLFCLWLPGNPDPDL